MLLEVSNYCSTVAIRPEILYCDSQLGDRNTYCRTMR